MGADKGLCAMGWARAQCLKDVKPHLPARKVIAVARNAGFTYTAISLETLRHIMKMIKAQPCTSCRKLEGQGLSRLPPLVERIREELEDESETVEDLATTCSARGGFIRGGFIYSGKHGKDDKEIVTLSPFSAIKAALWWLGRPFGVRSRDILPRSVLRRVGYGGETRLDRVESVINHELNLVEGTLRPKPSEPV